MMLPLVTIQNALVGACTSSCIVQSLIGTKNSSSSPSCTFHTKIGASSISIVMVEKIGKISSFGETGNSSGACSGVELWPDNDAIETNDDVVDQRANGVRLPLGHQDTSCGTSPCPITAEDNDNDNRDEQPSDGPPPPKLATVAVVYDRVTKSVLLTRRPSSMRIFPNAWVMPGGKVDDDDPSLTAAALRELKEETGLDITIDKNDDDNNNNNNAVLSSSSPLCLWESCFPTSFEEWRARRQAGGRCAHHLIVYILVPVVSSSSPSNLLRLTLQEEECDCACWVPVKDLVEGTTSSDNDTTAKDEDGSSSSIQIQEHDEAKDSDNNSYYPRAAGVPPGDSIPSFLLKGVYPNSHGQGIGRGHLFAISQLAKHIQST